MMQGSEDIQVEMEGGRGLDAKRLQAHVLHYACALV